MDKTPAYAASLVMLRTQWETCNFAGKGRLTSNAERWMANGLIGEANAACISLVTVGYEPGVSTVTPNAGGVLFG
jgi:hypothetical protein